MNVISVLTTSIVLILFFWLTYNLPAFIIGFMQWIKIKKRRESSLNVRAQSIGWYGLTIPEHFISIFSSDRISAFWYAIDQMGM